MSKHLKVLERAGLIARGHDPQRPPRRFLLPPLKDATAWLRGYRNPGSLQLTTPGEGEIVLKRLFAFPRRWVFDAFTKPELLKRFLFGVPDVSLIARRVALKAGDTFRYVWRNPDGTKIGMSGVCLEFKRPDRLVATEKFDRPWYPGAAVGTVVFMEEDGVSLRKRSGMSRRKPARSSFPPISSTLLRWAMTAWRSSWSPANRARNEVIDE